MPNFLGMRLGSKSSSYSKSAKESKMVLNVTDRLTPCRRLSTKGTLMLKSVNDCLVNKASGAYHVHDVRSHT